MPDTLISESVDEAAIILRAGGTVAFPTETVYGLGADAWSAESVARVFVAKGRPADNPTIVHVAEASQVADVARAVPELARKLLDAFAPGPITVVVPRSPALPSVVTGGLDTVAVRVPSHPVAQALLRSFGGPIAAPSANLSGRPSPTEWSAVAADLDGRIDCILKGGKSSVGLESTVVDCTQDYPVILRPGFVTADDIASVLGYNVRGLQYSQDVKLGQRSPGTRHRHYAPAARVILVNASDLDRLTRSGDLSRGAFIGLYPPPALPMWKLTQICETAQEYAHELYSFFRRCEARGVEVIYCGRVAQHGVGTALMDRLERAAAATAG